MECWRYRRPAAGVCRFCGRATCREDAATRPYMLQLFRGRGPLAALVVEDAVWCGTCAIRPDPVELPELDEAGAPLEP
jgi:hypothetical protein